jgi:hypothetical protein
MRRRNRFTLFLALPVAVFLWVFGWSLYWTGSKKIGSSKKLAKPRKKESSKELTFSVLMPEQKYAE